MLSNKKLKQYLEDFISSSELMSIKEDNGEFLISKKGKNLHHIFIYDKEYDYVLTYILKKEERRFQGYLISDKDLDMYLKIVNRQWGH